MGRPLNKKYFGNRNVGSVSTLADNGIGGEGLRVDITNAGSYDNTIASVDSSLPAPTLPGGVQAADPVTYSQPISAVVVHNGSGYAIGDTFRDYNGPNNGTGTLYRVTSLKVISVTKTANGTNYDNDNNIVFDSPSNWTTPLELDVTSNTTGSLGTFTVTQYGVWTGPTAAPTHLVANTTNTRNGVDQNATGAEFDLTWGVNTVEIVTVVEVDDNGGFGYYDSGNGAPTHMTSGTGNEGATIRVTYEVTRVVFGESGSGYTGSEDLTVVFTDGDTTAEGTLALTEDVGGFQGSGNNVGNDTNAPTQQDNAIIIYANVGGMGGTLIGDIIKQKGSRRYQVRTADGVATVKLVASDTPGVGEAYITAVDSTTSAHYWVTKLTGHRATIYPKGDGTPDFPLINGEPQHVGWTFGNAVAPATNVLGVVTIENA